MPFEITRAEVWAGEVADQPGALAEVLGALERAGANLEFVIVRPSAGLPGTGVLFVAPVPATAEPAAEEAGLRRSGGMHVLRIVGPDRPGLGAGIALELGRAGLNIAGLSAAAVGEQSILYVRFETEADVRTAAQVLTAKLA